MAFGSMLGTRVFLKKKVPIEKKIWNLMEMALDPWILPGVLAKDSTKFHRWLWMGSSHLGLANKTTTGSLL